eukprot:ANDGO_08194.mRNA.1 hypothetical protein
MYQSTSSSPPLDRSLRHIHDHEMGPVQKYQSVSSPSSPTAGATTRRTGETTSTSTSSASMLSSGSGSAAQGSHADASNDKYSEVSSVVHVDGSSSREVPTSNPQVRFLHDDEDTFTYEDALAMQRSMRTEGCIIGSAFAVIVLVFCVLVVYAGVHSLHY